MKAMTTIRWSSESLDAFDQKPFDSYTEPCLAAKRSFLCKQEFGLDAAQPFNIRPPYLYFTDVDQAKLHFLPQSISKPSHCELLEVR